MSCKKHNYTCIHACVADATVHLWLVDVCAYYGHMLLNTHTHTHTQFPVLELTNGMNMCTHRYQVYMRIITCVPGRCC